MNRVIPVCLAILLVGVTLTKQPAQLAFVPEHDLPPIPMVVVPPEDAKSQEDKTVITKEENSTDEPVLPDLPRPVPPVDPSRASFGIPEVAPSTVSPDLRPSPAPREPFIQFQPKVTPTILRPSEQGQYGDLPWPTDRDYPQEARSRRESGDVILVIEVGPDGGAPTEVSIESSSKSSHLDAHAREWVRRHWRFKPTGEAKAYRTRFTYQLSY